MSIAKQLYDAQLQQIFNMLLKIKQMNRLASELKISIRTVQNLLRLEQRYIGLLETED